MSGARWKIIADDLSGACDAAVAFSVRGLGVEVLLDWMGEGSAARDVIAISTESRDVAPDEAVRRLRTAMGETDLRNFDFVFKKIDSVFRGNTFVEIVASAKIVPADLVVIAPAYPALGRVCRGGVVEVQDLAGGRSVRVLEELCKAGLKAEGIPRGIGSADLGVMLVESLARGVKSVVCDAERQEDLEELVAAVMLLGVRMFWAGSGGLAHALAEVSCKGARRAQRSVASYGEVVCVVGSDHPVTMRQLDRLRAEVGLVERAMEDVECGMSGALVLRVKRESTEDEVRRVFADVSADEVSCLVMTGGDTAMLVCRALGMRAIELADEFAPGLPMGIAGGGRFDGCRVMVKSGGFGEADILCRVFEAFGAGR